jgi:abortive infection bacteriophage resistance protein
MKIANIITENMEQVEFHLRNNEKKYNIWSINRIIKFGILTINSSVSVTEDNASLSDKYGILSSGLNFDILDQSISATNNLQGKS